MLAKWVSSWGGATSQFISTLLNDWILTNELTCLASYEKRILCMVLMVMFPLEIKCQDGLHLYSDGEVGSPSLGHPLHSCSHLAVTEFVPVSSSGADFQEVPMFFGVGIVKSWGLILHVGLLTSGSLGSNPGPNSVTLNRSFDSPSLLISSSAKREEYCLSL